MKKENRAKKAPKQTAEESLDKDSKQEQSRLPEIGVASKKKRRELSTKTCDVAKCDNSRESDSSNAEEACGPSDSDSDGGGDELQFVGNANSDELSGEDSDVASSKTQGEVEVSFELFDPQEEDAGALLLLLRHSRVYTRLGLQPQQLRELAEVVANQGNIGSVIRAAAEAAGPSEAALGLVSLVSVGQYPKATEPLATKILSLAQAHASDEAMAELRKLLPFERSSSSTPAKGMAARGTKSSKTNAALFISCRFTNLPLEMAAEAIEALFADVKWSLETAEMDEEERPWYRFSHVIGIAPVYRDTKAEGTVKKKKQSLGLDFTPTFAEFEQGVLSEGAPVAFAAPTNQTIRFSSLPSGNVSTDENTRKHVSVMQTLQEYLLVYALPYDQFVLNQRKVKQRLALKNAVDSA